LCPTVAVVGGGSLLAGRLAWRARRARPTTGLDALVERIAIVRSVLGDIGRVWLEGTWRSAYSGSGALTVGQPVGVSRSEVSS
jgi:membrane-bound serine protease (ClpP class)